MALLGDDYQIYLKDGYIPQAVNTFFRNQWWFQQPFFEITNAPGGDTINEIIEYSTTDNSEAYVRGAPDPEPDKLNTVRAYFDKDYWQGAGKNYGVDKANAANSGTEINVAMDKKSIDNSLINLSAKVNAAMLTSLAAQVDATTAFSDASLSRATYSLASLETAVSGVLTLAVMEDMLETLQNTTYGILDSSDAVWLMPRNQLTNLSRLTLAEAQQGIMMTESIDGGRVMKTHSFEGIPIGVVPGMTSTEIYLMKRSTTKLFMNMAVETTPKDVHEWADYWVSRTGANLVVADPRRCGKNTGVTA